MDAPHTAPQLPARTTPTWEVELLISGVAVFAMLQLPGWLDGVLLTLEPRVNGDWRMVVVMSYVYAKSAAVVLAATFVIHLMLRAMWIALVGMQSVYPAGIRYDRLKLGPIQSEVERERGFDMAATVERADNRASVAFAVGVLIASTLAVICVVFCGGLALVNLAAAAFGWKVNVMVLFATIFAILFLPVLAAMLLDRQLGARLPRDAWLRHAISTTLRIGSRLGMGVGRNPILSILSSNGGQRQAMLLFNGAVILAMVTATTSLVGIQRPEWIGNYGLFPASDALDVETDYYDDQRDPQAGRAQPYIPGMVVRGPYLKLVVPYVPRRVEALMQQCPIPGSANDEARAAALLACLGKLHAVSLDGRPLPGLRYDASNDPRTDRPALLAMIDVRDLPAGRHELRIARPPYSDRKPRKDRPDPGYHRIVFWR
ncbi:MAG: hypothetical protein J0L59_03590 [Xanthomonadales bacterium]|nr:hypothetical protein [Xanthomonadales bacterium]